MAARNSVRQLPASRQATASQPSEDGQGRLRASIERQAEPDGEGNADGDQDGRSQPEHCSGEAPMIEAGAAGGREGSKHRHGNGNVARTRLFPSRSNDSEEPDLTASAKGKFGFDRKRPRKSESCSAPESHGSFMTGDSLAGSPPTMESRRARPAPGCRLSMQKEMALPWGIEPQFSP